MTERLKHGTIDEEAEACLGLRCMRAETEAQVCHPEAALSPSHLLIQHRRCKVEISLGQDQ